MHQFQFREYSDRDTEGILSLFRTSFQKEASEAWHRWKYKRSPWGSRGYVAIEGDTVAAFYGGIRLQFIFNGKTLWSYQFCDVMTHPQYRGCMVSKNPLVVKLGKLFYKENPMDFAFGFPSLRHVRLQSLRLGGEGYRIVRSYKKDRLQRHSTPWTVRVKEGWEFLDKKDLGAFIVRAEDNVLRLVKDEQYTRWRYIENPLKIYRALVFKKMGRTKGLIVFKVEDTWFHILEIFCKTDKDRKDILAVLEAYVIKHMKSVKGIKAWFHPLDPGIKDLDRFGYTSEDSIPIAFKSVNKACGVTSETFYTRYFYSMGDYDAS